MLKIVGICILIFTIYIVSRQICTARLARLRCLEEVQAFLLSLRRSLSSDPRPPAEVAQTNCGSCLKDSGFVGRLCAGDGLKEALLGSGVDKLLPSDARALVLCLFADFGRGELADERRGLDSAISDIEPIVKRERAECEGRRRLVRVLSSAASVGLIILLI